MTDSTKNNIAWGIRIIIAFLFIISAIAKLYPSPYFAISTFEVKQLYTLGFSENIAPFFSRILIGIELALGILILQNNWLKKFLIPVTILLLVVFIGHLTYVTFLSGGDSGNCGCFGELIPMTPIEAIIKNIVAVGLLVYLYKLLTGNESKTNNFWILTTVLLSSILSLFMLAPIQPIASKLSVSEPEEMVSDTITDQLIPTDTIAAEVQNIEVAPIIKKDSVKAKVAEKVVEKVAVIDAPKPTKSGYSQYFSNIDKDKKVLCFFVPGCDHCREAAKEITALRKKDPKFPPVSIIFMNEEADLIPSFFKEAGGEYPYKIIEVIPFWTTLGKGKDTPGIKYLWNGNTMKYWWGISDDKFNNTELNSMVNKPFSELK